MNDAHLLPIKGLVLLEYDDDAVRASLSSKVAALLDGWRSDMQIGMTGCIQTRFDEFLTDNRTIMEVVELLDRAENRVRAFGQTVPGPFLTKLTFNEYADRSAENLLHPLAQIRSLLIQGLNAPPYKDLDSLRALSVEDFIAHLRALKLDGGYSTEVLEIHYLMASLDTFRFLEIEDHDNPMLSNELWEPKSVQVQEIIRRLTAEENRCGLRAWYRKPVQINSFAERFRQYLCRRVHEHLGASVTEDGPLDPLITAIMKRNPKEVARQLEGIYINERTEEGCTPIFYAVLAGNANILKQILDKGADPNCIAEEPGATIMALTPLSLALQKRHFGKDAKFDEIITLLKEYGATATGCE